MTRHRLMPPRKADHKFLVRLQAVQRDKGGNEDADRQDHVDQLRHGQGGGLQEDERVLSTRHDQVQLGQGGGKQGQSRRRHNGPQGGCDKLAQEVAVDQAHDEISIPAGDLPRLKLTAVLIMSRTPDATAVQVVPHGGDPN